MAASNSTASITLNQEQAAAFGVVLNTDGTIETIRKGTFDAGQADDIAIQLILMASRIRTAARSALYQN